MYEARDSSRSSLESSMAFGGYTCCGSAWKKPKMGDVAGAWWAAWVFDETQLQSPTKSAFGFYTPPSISKWLLYVLAPSVNLLHVLTNNHKRFLTNPAPKVTPRMRSRCMRRLTICRRKAHERHANHFSVRILCLIHATVPNTFLGELCQKG